MILTLQKQIVIFEHEIKLLKDREVDQKNKASGYETLLRDGIPLNEHFLALKNKFNNEQDMLKKQLEIMEEDIKKEQATNKQRNNKIDIQKQEFEEISQKYQDYKEITLKQMKDLETKLFVESHTKDMLQEEKIELTKEYNNIKTSNQNMGRTITKDKYHNNREEQAKQRTREIEAIKQEIMEVSEQIEAEQAKL